MVGGWMVRCWEVGWRTALSGCMRATVCAVRVVPHLSDGPCDDGLEHRAAVVVQQVDLVDDEQPHERRVRAIV
eukprot:362428-Chlamydomonas_euryale.AAC.1